MDPLQPPLSSADSRPAPAWIKEALIAFHVLWLCFAAYEIWALSKAASEFLSAREKLEAVSQSIDLSQKQLLSVISQTDEKTRELQFLHGLLNIVPQDSSYARTQKAIAEEVQSLRRQVGRRVNGRVHVVVDTKANKLYVKKGLTLLFQADCSVGRGGILRDKATGRRWEFVTPQGEFKVLGKLQEPVWTKPDWAFVELGEKVPPPEDPSRKVKGELGAYVLNLGDGYLIHGTKNEAALGTAVSHGCVRLGAENLEKLYNLVPIGTKIYIY